MSGSVSISQAGGISPGASSAESPVPNLNNQGQGLSLDEGRGSKTEKHRAAPSDAAASTVAVTNQARAVIDMDAFGTPLLTCRHQLLARVREMLKGDCHVDTSELVQTLRRIGSASLTDETNSLAEAFMRADAPTHGDTTRKDLVTLLKLSLIHI